MTAETPWRVCYPSTEAALRMTGISTPEIYFLGDSIEQQLGEDNFRKIEEKSATVRTNNWDRTHAKLLQAKLKTLFEAKDAQVRLNQQQFLKLRKPYINRHKN